MLNPRVGRSSRWVAWGGAVLTAALLAACGSPAPTPRTSLAPATRQPVVSSGAFTDTTLTPLETSAGKIGEASYSGYVCTISPLGCACDTPVIQHVRFTFTPDNRLLYDFAPAGGTASEWQLDHAGVNQWSYGIPLKDSQGQPQMVILGLISFTQDGYVQTQVAKLITEDVVKCPDVFFCRVTAVVTPTP